MPILSIRNKILPRTIFEALEALKKVQLHNLDEVDRMTFAGASDVAMIGEYTKTHKLLPGRTYEVMVVVDADNILFITCDEDGIDVRKDFNIS